MTHGVWPEAWLRLHDRERAERAPLESRVPRASRLVPAIASPLSALRAPRRTPAAPPLRSTDLACC